MTLDDVHSPDDVAAYIQSLSADERAEWAQHVKAFKARIRMGGLEACGTLPMPPRRGMGCFMLGVLWALQHNAD